MFHSLLLTQHPYRLCVWKQEWSPTRKGLADACSNTCFSVCTQSISCTRSRGEFSSRFIRIRHIITNTSVLFNNWSVCVKLKVFLKVLIRNVTGCWNVGKVPFSFSLFMMSQQMLADVSHVNPPSISEGASKRKVMPPPSSVWKESQPWQQETLSSRSSTTSKCAAWGLEIS